MSVNNPNNSIWVVLPAAGVGKRMQADRPKQYLELAGKTVIEHTLSCFEKHGAIKGIVVILHPEDPYWKDLKISETDYLHVAEGGNERCDSVLNGLNYLQQETDIKENDWVMVHDAARPCLSQNDLTHLISTLWKEPVGGILAMPVRDTMKRAVAGTNDIEKTENRDGLWHALTPQMFRFGILQSSLESALEKNIAITDEASAIEASAIEASAIEAAGKKALLVEGQASNIKITRPADLALAEFFLKDGEGK